MPKALGSSRAGPQGPPPACTAQAAATTLTSHHRWTFLLSDGSAAVTGHVSYQHCAVARDVGLLSSVMASGGQGALAGRRPSGTGPCHLCALAVDDRTVPAPALPRPVAAAAPLVPTATPTL